MIILVQIWQPEMRHNFFWSVQVSLQQANLCQTISKKEKLCRIRHQINWELIKWLLLIVHESDGRFFENLLTAFRNWDACPFFTYFPNFPNCWRFYEFWLSQFQLPFSHSDIAKQKMLWRRPCAFVKLGMWSIPNWNPIFVCLKSYVSHEICNFACRSWQWCICETSSLLYCHVCSSACRSASKAHSKDFRNFCGKSFPSNLGLWATLDMYKTQRNWLLLAGDEQSGAVISCWQHVVVPW